MGEGKPGINDAIPPEIDAGWDDIDIGLEQKHVAKPDTKEADEKAFLELIERGKRREKIEQSGRMLTKEEEIDLFMSPDDWKIYIRHKKRLEKEKRIEEKAKETSKQAEAMVSEMQRKRATALHRKEVGGKTVAAKEKIIGAKTISDLAKDYFEGQLSHLVSLENFLVEIGIYKRRIKEMKEKYEELKQRIGSNFYVVKNEMDPQEKKAEDPIELKPNDRTNKKLVIFLFLQITKADDKASNALFAIESYAIAKASKKTGKTYARFADLVLEHSTEEEKSDASDPDMKKAIALRAEMQEITDQYEKWKIQLKKIIEKMRSTGELERQGDFRQIVYVTNENIGDVLDGTETVNEDGEIVDEEEGLIYSLAHLKAEIGKWEDEYWKSESDPNRKKHELREKGKILERLLETVQILEGIRGDIRNKINLIKQAANQKLEEEKEGETPEEKGLRKTKEAKATNAKTLMEDTSERSPFKEMLANLETVNDLLKNLDPLIQRAVAEGYLSPKMPGSKEGNIRYGRAGSSLIELNNVLVPKFTVIDRVVPGSGDRKVTVRTLVSVTEPRIETIIPETEAAIITARRLGGKIVDVKKGEDGGKKYISARGKRGGRDREERDDEFLSKDLERRNQKERSGFKKDEKTKK